MAEFHRTVESDLMVELNWGQGRRFHRLHMMKETGRSGDTNLQCAAAAGYGPNDRQNLMHIDSDEAGGVRRLFS